MGELQQAMRVLGGLGLHVTQYPSGRWGFVGRVPAELAYQHADGSIPTESEQRDIAQSSLPAMTCKAYGIKTRVFETEQQARFAAARAGYQVL